MTITISNAQLEALYAGMEQCGFRLATPRQHGWHILNSTSLVDRPRAVAALRAALEPLLAEVERGALL